MDGFETVIRKMLSVGIAGCLWVDGSFLTQKIEPSDVDFVLGVSSDFVGKATADQLETLRWLAQDDLKTPHFCDTYVRIEYPAGHLLYARGEQVRKYWADFFGFSRRKQAKGIGTVDIPGGVS